MESMSLRPPENGIRVLAVDDEPDILRFLSKCLSREGYLVETCQDPVRAADMIAERDFDLVLLDIKMPGMDGMVLLKHAKEARPQSEVIMMTGYATVETAVRSIKLGAFDYITKPFDAGELLGMTRRAVQQHGNSNDPNRYRDWDKMKEEFLSNTSHELRTPMASIKAASSILLDDYHTKGNMLAGDRPERMLSIIDRNSDRMIRLIDDLLDIFRYGKNKVELNKVPVSINKLAAECVEDLTAPCQERGLTMVGDFEEGLAPVPADPLKLRQALLNLVGNAMKFTPAGGRITVGTRGRDGGIEIFVKDTGVGIPPDQQKKIFDKFYQVDGSSTRGSQGLGLGLALAKCIAEAHGGELSLDSMPGYGSTFTVRLPLERDAVRENNVSDIKERETHHV